MPVLTSTPDDTDNNAERPGQPHDHATNDQDKNEVEEAGGHKSAVGGRAISIGFVFIFLRRGHLDGCFLVEMVQHREDR